MCNFDTTFKVSIFVYTKLQHHYKCVTTNMFKYINYYGSFNRNGLSIHLAVHFNQILKTVE